MAINTSGHYHTIVPRPHKNEWINWRKQVSVANLQAIIVAISSSLATLPKPRPYSGASRGCYCTSKVAGKTSANRVKEKSVVLDNSWATDFAILGISLITNMSNI